MRGRLLTFKVRSPSQINLCVEGLIGYKRSPQYLTTFDMLCTTLSRLVFSLACLTASSLAHSAYVINIRQVGPNVVATGSGTINTAGLTFLANVAGGGEMAGQVGRVLVGSSTPISSASVWSGATGSVFGTPAAKFIADSTTGGHVGPLNTIGLITPNGYVSGTPISSSATWLAVTLADQGLTPGTSYVWTWGAGPTADRLTVNVAAATAAPASVPTMSEVGTAALTLLLAGTAFLFMRRKR